MLWDESPRIALVLRFSDNPHAPTLVRNKRDSDTWASGALRVVCCGGASVEFARLPILTRLGRPCGELSLTLTSRFFATARNIHIWLQDKSGNIYHDFILNLVVFTC